MDKIKLPRKMKKALRKAFARIGISGQYDELVKESSKKKAHLTIREYLKYRKGIEEVRQVCWDNFKKVYESTLGEEMG
jgi:hypothetical protein